APEFIYPQFATHNAQTLATIYHLADPSKYYAGQYEFQCLHGMGEPLYEQVVGPREQNKLGVPCRIYAPVGNHETLLAYLVRRLLENGANTSFVNRIADKTLKVEDLIQSPIYDIRNAAKLEGSVGLKHPSIPLPLDMYGTLRKNSKGYDLANDAPLAALDNTAQQLRNRIWQSHPLLGNSDLSKQGHSIAITNPAQNDEIVGYVQEADLNDVEIALNAAEQIQIEWANTPKDQRAQYLKRAADLMESRIQELMVLLCRESGKTYANAIAEVREAVDFLRYYATQVENLPNNTTIQPLGTVLCISPWNFPLAIFSGQIAAALVSGNCVIAKPAEQTPLIAAQAVQILWEAGIPHSAVQLLPGRGETVGAQLSQDRRIDGIMFTGSTEVAKILQKTVAKRLAANGQSIPLIAETGGQNAMIVDSSALTEQVVLDVVSSAFDSAGQRCSALRILCVQEDSAATVIKMLKGAMHQLIVGNPAILKTDIGPVIDDEAKQTIDQHIQKMKSKGYPVHQLMFGATSQTELDKGTFVVPTAIELPNLDDLQREVFGPVLHIISYKYGELEQLISRINAKGYGLTMGLHTRIDETIQTVIQHAEVGNLYINRNIVGAVVGVQPFGGEGLSGTGPKAGGPLYMYRLMQDCSNKVLATPFAVKNEQTIFEGFNREVYQSLQNWAKQHLPQASREIEPFGVGKFYELQGPTGESNQYIILPRHRVLSIADTEQNQLHQLLAIFAVGSQAAVMPNSPLLAKHKQTLPKDVLDAITTIKNITTDDFDAVLHHGSREEVLSLQQEIASRSGAIVGITHVESNESIPLERLVIERAISVNTAAAGGNASLMTMSD
ncbi:MAG TPA: trifunctional transcriptional regulator/proline dehydrogenase/L-glutamate gamma-semialdehyde dehydrogenase, partial [Acinetobacter nosocomialis]|nr:trifunctional transcriptional regulator/proline dehydrogenase/L-glutamate gamma-semialdehyde dehydrogenase [Acinetobacter nosocomialis]